jgi:glutaredoxin 2
MKLPSARWFKSVLKEFKAHDTRYICHASKVFQNKWDDPESEFRKNLKRKATIWARIYSNGMVIVNYTDVLFYSNTNNNYLLPDETMRALKIEFLKWLIKKLEK